MEALERNCSYLFFIFGYWLLALSCITDKFDIRYFLITLLLLLFLYIWGKNSFSYEFLILLLSFTLSTTVWNAGKKIKKSESLDKFICLVSIIQALYLIYLYFSPRAYYANYSQGIVSTYLTLGFPNSNEAGMIVYSTIISLLICFMCFSNKLLKFLIIGILAFLGYLLFLTGSRTCIFGVIFFIAFVLYNRKGKKVLYKSKVFLFAIVIFPLIFLYLYVYLFNNGYVFNSIFNDKSFFSGREYLYLERLKEWDNYLTGNLNEFKFNNVHNGLLSILSNTGIIGFILYISYTVLNLFDLQNNEGNSLISRMGFIALLSIFILSSFESSFLTGGKIYYIQLLLFIYFANHEEVSSHESETVNSGTE